jgi:phosphohistidine phosphatase
MLLLLIRHAQAAQQDETSYPDDSLRPLVAKGRKVQRRMCKQLRRRDLVPSRVFSSPWKRAWQTARIVIEETGLPKDARLPCHALAAAPDMAALAAEIGEVGADETIVLVGHEPWMSELASLLLTGKSAGLHVDFAKSGIMGIETAGLSADSGAGTLRFYLVP